MTQLRDKLHTIDGRLFQARIWREYAMTWHGRPTRTGVDQRWCEEIGRMSYRDCLRRARVNAYLARRLNRRASTPPPAEEQVSDRSADDIERLVSIRKRLQDLGTFGWDDIELVLRLLDASQARLAEVERERNELKRRLTVLRDEARKRFGLGLMPWLLDDGPCSDTALQLSNILSGWYAAEERASALAALVQGLGQLVDRQAEDEGLWFIAATAPEGYLQQELRKLHAAIEHAREAVSQAAVTAGDTPAKTVDNGS